MVTKSHSTLRRGHKAFVAAGGVTNHLERKPVQVMEVGWDGTPMWPTSEGSEATKCRLFVATLPYPQHGHVEATLGMRQGAWFMCHAHAWDLFGGVAARTSATISRPARSLAPGAVRWSSARPRKPWAPTT